jgi:hypothetical protein
MIRPWTDPVRGTCRPAARTATGSVSAPDERRDGSGTLPGRQVRRTRRPGRFRQVVSLVNVGNGTSRGRCIDPGRSARRVRRAGGCDDAEALAARQPRSGRPGNTVLRPGERLNVVLEFSSPLMGRIRYTPRVLAGRGAVSLGDVRPLRPKQGRVSCSRFTSPKLVLGS